VVMEFLSGALFPIDVLPPALQKVVMSLPFPYMIFFPVQVYLGKITGSAQIQGFLTSFVWLGILWYFMKNIWAKGLKAYQAFGR
ncbi:MAG TPA: ABC-2 family transporter protein, partial [Patescibacteria group bacterium]|nr:ABC-2 family transporter protein [Patescibacteria group bacterium]